jgi:hypothetical protein
MSEDAPSKPEQSRQSDSAEFEELAPLGSVWQWQRGGRFLVCRVVEYRHISYAVWVERIDPVRRGKFEWRTRWEFRRKMERIR